MKKFLAVMLLGISAAYAQVPTINSGASEVTTPTGTTVIHNMWDDGHAVVPLEFGFQYFGKTFTNSVMYDNGVVGFFAPATATTSQVGCDPTNAYCGGNVWSSQQFTTTLGSSWNYMIAPLHTDMRPVAGSVYSTTGDTSQMTYRWQNIGEYYNPGNLNTFSLQIKPSGFIGVNYEMINIQSSNVSVGLTGDLSQGEYAQHYWNPAGTLINNTTNMIPNWNVTSTGVDQCSLVPLSSPSCPNYTSAQCTINQLYSTACPGYAAAFLSQQCASNPLYDISCPGYAAAYLEYQCSIDPLYSTTCQGYATAYHDQQCSINPLYATDCTGYAQAYFDQQCLLSGLYDRTCPNYAEAYAAAHLTTSTATTTTTTEVTSVTTTSTSDGSSSVAVAVVADPIVNQAVTSTATSTTSVTATVPLVTTTTATSTATAATTGETTNASNASVSSTPTTQTASTETKTDAKPTARQEIQAKREAAAKAKAVEDGKNLASNMGKVADMEAQRQVQNVVVAAMGFVPGFDAYGKTFVPDGVGYKPFTVYKGQVNVDNARLGRRMFGPSDRLHDQLVDSQYRGN